VLRVHPIPTVHPCCYLSFFVVATLCVNKDVYIMGFAENLHIWSGPFSGFLRYDDTVTMTLVVDGADVATKERSEDVTGLSPTGRRSCDAVTR